MLATRPDHLPTYTESILTQQLGLRKSRLTHSGRRLSLSNPPFICRTWVIRRLASQQSQGHVQASARHSGSQAVNRCLTEHRHRSNAVRCRTQLMMSEWNAGHAKARKCQSTVNLLWFREVPGACQTSLQPNGLIMAKWRKGHGNRVKHSKWES